MNECGVGVAGWFVAFHLNVFLSIIRAWKLPDNTRREEAQGQRQRVTAGFSGLQWVTVGYSGLWRVMVTVKVTFWFGLLSSRFELSFIFDFGLVPFAFAYSFDFWLSLLCVAPRKMFANVFFVSLFCSFFRLPLGQKSNISMQTFRFRIFALVCFRFVCIKYSTYDGIQRDFTNRFRMFIGYAASQAYSRRRWGN